MPNEVRLTDGSGRTLLIFRKMHSFGARAPANVFVDGKQFFLAWYDGPPTPAGGGAWSGFHAIVALNDEPTVFSSVACGIPEPGSRRRPLLCSPGFEQTVVNAPVSLENGARLPGIHGRSVWRLPYSGAQLVTDVVHSGRVAAFVENRNGGYLLWTQTLPVASFPPGSRWRLSAWVRGRDITPGTPAWKVGTVRFTLVHEDRTEYVASESLTGSFDWQQVSVEAQIPADLQQLSIQLGLNGALGRMWIDDVHLERLP